MVKTYRVFFKTAKRFEKKFGRNHQEEFTSLTAARVYACKVLRSGYVSGKMGYLGGLGQDVVIHGVESKSAGDKLTLYEVVSRMDKTEYVANQSEKNPNNGYIRRRKGRVSPSTGRATFDKWSNWVKP